MRVRVSGMSFKYSAFLKDIGSDAYGGFMQRFAKPPCLERAPRVRFSPLPLKFCSTVPVFRPEQRTGNALVVRLCRRAGRYDPYQRQLVKYG